MGENALFMIIFSAIVLIAGIEYGFHALVLGVLHMQQKTNLSLHIDVFCGFASLCDTFT